MIANLRVWLTHPLLLAGVDGLPWALPIMLLVALLAIV